MLLIFWISLPQLGQHLHLFETSFVPEGWKMSGSNTLVNEKIYEHRFLTANNFNGYFLSNFS
jgi:hypothetical protein